MTSAQSVHVCPDLALLWLFWTRRRRRSSWRHGRQRGVVVLGVWLRRFVERLERGEVGAGMIRRQRGLGAVSDDLPQLAVERLGRRDGSHGRLATTSDRLPQLAECVAPPSSLTLPGRHHRTIRTARSSTTSVSYQPEGIAVCCATLSTYRRVAPRRSLRFHKAERLVGVPAIDACELLVDQQERRGQVERIRLQVERSPLTDADVRGVPRPGASSTGRSDTGNALDARALRTASSLR